MPEKWRDKFVENIDAIKLSYDSCACAGNGYPAGAVSLHEADALEAADVNSDTRLTVTDGSNDLWTQGCVDLG